MVLLAIGSEADMSEYLMARDSTADLPRSLHEDQDKEVKGGAELHRSQ